MKRFHHFIVKNHRWAIAILAIGIAGSSLVVNALQKQKEQGSIQQVYKTQTASAATMPQSAGDGINYELYKILKLPSGRRTRSIPDMPSQETQLVKKGQSPKIDLSQSSLKDHMTMRFEGYIVMPQNGEYTFLLYSDAGSKMWIDGELVVNNDGVHTARRRSSSKIQFQQGVHSIKVEYFELKDDQMLKAYRKSPQFFREEIPTKALYTNNPTPNTCDLTVNAGADQYIELPNQTLTLVGNGDCVSTYLRSQLSGPSQSTIASPASANTTVTDLVPGTYTYQLTATDDQGNAKTDTVQVEVNMIIIDPPAPEVNAGNDQQIILPQTSTQLEGTANGDNITVKRTQIKGPNQATILTPNQTNTSISNLRDGTYIFRLNVKDQYGSEIYDDVQITVLGAANSGNVPPVVNAGPDQTTIMPDNAIQLIAKANDQDGTIVKTVRTKISGSDDYSITHPNATQTSITNLAPGTYVFRLTATDNQGAEGYDDVQVTVNMVIVDPLPPTVNAGDDQTITLPTSTINLQGSASDGSNNPVAVVRTKVSGPASYTIANPNNAQTSVTNLAAGIYVFRLTAISSLSASPIYDDVQVTVNNNITPPPPTSTFTPTYYVSPNGGGNGTSASSPLKLSQVWSKLKPGDIVGLMDGTYTGPDSMITPPSGLSGISGKPITIRAINGGKAIIDGQRQYAPVALESNDRFVLQGFDARNAGGQNHSVTVVMIKDSDNVIVKEVVGINARGDANIFRNRGGTNVLFEDDAGLGEARKTFSSSQKSKNTTFRRTYGMFTKSDAMGPKHVYALAYNSDNTECENCIATINNQMPNYYELIDSDGSHTNQFFSNKEIQQPDGVFGHDGQDNGFVVNHVAIRGSIFYQPANQDFWQTSYKYRAAPFTVEIPNFELENNISYIEPGAYTNYRNVNLSSNGKVSKLTQIGGELGHIGGGRTQSNNYSSSNCNAIQGGYSIVNPNPAITNGKGANIMKRYVNGVLTDQDLRPWPMEDRIKEASSREGFGTISVTDTIFGLCGGTKPDFGGVHNAPTNINPRVNAGGDQSITLPLASALLTAIANDTDGTIVSTQRIQVSGPTSVSINNPTGVMTMVGGLTTAGTYIFRVTVTDNNGATASDDIQITVNPTTSTTNMPPIVNAGVDQNITLPTSNVSINANASDPDGSITSITRSKLSGPNTYTLINPNTTNLTVTNLTTAGTYLFRITVTDNDGATAHDDVQVTVSDNTPPPSGDLTQIIATAKQRLTASASQRATLETQLKARTDTSSIDQIIESVRPKGTDTKVGKVYNQSFTLPKYASKYADQGFHVSIPSGYKPNKPTGVIFWMEGGGSSTDSLATEMRHNEDFDMNYEENGNTKSYVFPAAKDKYIVISGVAPRGQLLQAYGMPPLHANRRAGPATQEYLHAMYEEVAQHYNLDPNDVHLAGFSMGGNGAYYSAVKFGDRFGKIMASAGSIDMFEPKLFKNNLFTIIHGTYDAYFNSTSDCRKHFTPIEGARLAHNLLKSVNPLTIMNEYQGHHGRGDDPIAENGRTSFVNNTYKRNPYTADVFAMNPRLAYVQGSNYNVTRTDTDPTPDTLWVSINEIGNDTIPYTQAVTQGDGGCSSLAAFNNRSISQSTTPFKGGQAQVNNIGNNTITVTSQNVKSMSLRLHPAKMGIDTTRPVTVIVNGTNNQYNCNPSLFTALSYIDKRQDRGLVYQCQIDITNIQ